MNLEKELMENEFMHGFGDVTNVMADTVYFIDAATGKFYLIPKKVGEIRLRFLLKKRISEEPINTKEFRKYLRDICLAYKKLKELMDSVERKNNDLSLSFKLLQTFRGLLEKPIFDFGEYLKKSDDSEQFQRNFLPYLPQVDVASYSIDGIRNVRRIYNEVVDITQASKKAIKKFKTRD